MKGFFVTGTDTEIGKTYSTCLLMEHLVKKGYKVGGLKPVASGCEDTPEGLRNEDALALINSANIELPYELVNRYRFRPPIAPHIAAEQSSVTIKPERILEDSVNAAKRADYLLVEGVGGWQVPLGDHHSVSDLALLLELPVILVVGIRLGCINHSRLTLSDIERSGAPIAGWIANICEPENPVVNETLKCLRQMISAPLIAEIQFNQKNLLPKFAYWE